MDGSGGGGLATGVVVHWALTLLPKEMSPAKEMEVMSMSLISLVMVFLSPGSKREKNGKGFKRVFFLG